MGAGAAGLLAALTAARSGCSVVLIEGTPDGGRKILISGGGRCNILPSLAQPERYVTDSSPNTLKKMLRSWPLAEQRAFFEAELGIPLELEEESGKLFPASNKARDVRDGLVRQVREAGVKIWFGTRLTNLAQIEGGWRLDLEGSPPVDASAVILATGGLSVPATGSDGFGLDAARALGHVVTPTYPALTPLTATPHPHAALAGVSLTATLTAPGSRPAFSTTGGFLITHRGWSGPTVLDLSHLAIRGATGGGRQEIHAQWTPYDAAEWDKRLREGAGTVRSRLSDELPRRLVDALLADTDVEPERKCSQLRREHRLRVVSALTSYPLSWTGDEGYKKAEVTGGGVALSEIDPRTMESRRTPGLFFCGEILDAFGPIGGHNFLWAWATGQAAGAGAAAMVGR
ncbi:MAG: aminoacetone oxidase family FAD-binding enzyme [Gemmatimonadetes bacterium]|nr:aminoacetone oxidase family FAD-binding enzyme [Gemmatimonadota bacterium]